MLVGVDIEVGVLDVRSLLQLKCLQFMPYRHSSMLKILGLECLKNLVMYVGCGVEMVPTIGVEGIWSLYGLQVLEVWDSKLVVPNLKVFGELRVEHTRFWQLRTLTLGHVPFTGLLDLSSFPQLHKLYIEGCDELMGLTSSVPLIALELLWLIGCRSLEVLPDWDYFIAVIYFRVRRCGRVELTLSEIEKFEAMCPWLQLFYERVFDQSERSSSVILDEEDIEEVATHLNMQRSSPFIVLSIDKLTARYTGYGGVHAYGAIQANQPASYTRMVYYFEMTVKDHGKRCCIGLGFTSVLFDGWQMRGWDKNSYGYHGSDGMLYCEQEVGLPYGQGYARGDTVGAGIKYATQEIFFTRNGSVLPGVTVKDLNSLFYPTIGLGSPKEKVEVNFGQKKFMFDLESVC